MKLGVRFDGCSVPVFLTLVLFDAVMSIVCFYGYPLFWFLSGLKNGMTGCRCVTTVPFRLCGCASQVFFLVSESIGLVIDDL